MNRRHPRWQRSLLLVLGMTMALVACSTNKSGEGTTPEETPSKSQPLASAPLKDFARNQQEEVIRSSEPTIIAKTEPVPPAQETLKREIGNVYFPFGRWVLSQENQKALLDGVEYLKQHSEANLVIEGHCDERGSREYNLVLGEKRAQEVRRYLTARGLRNAVTVISFGKERPVCTEHDESCYRKNRRAHVVIAHSK